MIVTDAAEAVERPTEIAGDNATGGHVSDQRAPEPRKLVLLVDHDVASRRQVRHLLELHGLEVVQASNGVAALELVQRLPQSFRLVIVDMDLPGLSGSVLVETLRMFRPDLPAICMSSQVGAGLPAARRCLAKPLDGRDLAAALQNGATNWEQDGDGRIPPQWIARARERYAAAGDLVEAALELSRAAGADGVI